MKRDYGDSQDSSELFKVEMEDELENRWEGVIGTIPLQALAYCLGKASDSTR